MFQSFRTNLANNSAIIIITIGGINMNTLVYALIAAGFIIQACFIAVEHKKKYVAADILKGTASLIFVIIGFMGLKKGFNPETNTKIAIGLLFGMIGDILLNLRFVFEKIGQKIFLTGIVAFLIGHILYLVALIPHCSHLAASVIIGALLAAALLAYIFKTMEVKMAFKIFGILYLGAVIIMTVIALDAAFFSGSSSTSSVIYAIGAVLFTLSDIVLIFNTFSGVTRFSLRITNLTLYYIGQILIAVSLFFSR